MLVSFYFRNYRSVADKAGVSLVAIESDKQKPEHLVHIPRSSHYCLRAGVVYGANAAGKSTFCKALRYLQRLAVESRPEGKLTGREKFAFVDIVPETSDFDLRFVSENHLYRYYVTVTDKMIVNEVLLDESNADGEQMLFKRSVAKDGSVEIEFADNANASTRKMRSLASLGISPTQSFLSAVKLLIHGREDRGFLDPVIEWFSHLTIIAPGATFKHLERIVEDESLKAFVGKKLSDCSTGINAIQSTDSEISESDYKSALSMLPKEERDKILESDAARCVMRSGDDVVVFERHGEKISKMIVRAGHDSGGEKTLSLNQESDGTRRLLNLLPALYTLTKSNSVYVIDEVDRSLHPLLTREFVSEFLLKATHGQLVMTTHDNNLLDAGLLRRDEVWFAEKDTRESTHYFSLAEFKPRTLKSQGDYYLEGRFGAVPILRKIHFLESGEETHS